MGCGQSTSTLPVVVPAKIDRGFDLVVLTHIHIVKTNNQNVNGFGVSEQLTVRPDPAIPSSTHSSLKVADRREIGVLTMSRLGSDGLYPYSEGSN